VAGPAGADAPPLGGGLRARARAGTEVYLQLLADNPAFARTFLIEVLGAGPVALERRDAVHARFAQRLADAHAAIAEQAGGLPTPAPYVFRAAVGAIHELVLDCLLKRGAAALPELLEPVLEIELRLLSAVAPAASSRR
jgi:hypothetical protein